MEKEAQQQIQMTGTSALHLIKNLKDNLPNITQTQLIQQLEQLETVVGQLEQLKAKLYQQTQSGSGGQASADDQNSQTGPLEKIHEAECKYIVPDYGEE